MRRRKFIKLISGDRWPDRLWNKPYRRLPSSRQLHGTDSLAGLAADQVRAALELKTAKPPALEIPAKVLALADEVIE